VEGLKCYEYTSHPSTSHARTNPSSTMNRGATNKRNTQTGLNAGTYIFINVNSSVTMIPGKCVELRRTSRHFIVLYAYKEEIRCLYRSLAVPVYEVLVVAGAIGKACKTNRRR
jgi:hypothetical protein